MRYLVGLAVVVALVALVALPLGVSAQADEEPNSQEPSSEAAPEESALELKLDEAGVDVRPTAPRTFDGYTLEELELRKRRAAYGLIASAAVSVPGVTLLAVGMASKNCSEDFNYHSDSCRRLRTGGLTLTIAGGVGTIVTSILFGVRAHKLKLATHDYALEEMELRVKRMKIGLYSSAGALVAGALLAGIAYSQMGDWGEPSPEWTDPVAWTGVVLMLSGFVGLITTGPLLHARKHHLHDLQQARCRRPRRVQWDLARSRLVF